MNGVDYQEVPELDLTILTIARANKLTEIDRFLAAKDSDGRTKFLIIRVAAGIIGSYSIEDLKRLLMSRRKSVFSHRRGGHSIFVLEGKNDAPLIRWLKAYAEGSLKWPVQYHLAASMDEAMDLVRGLRRKHSA